MQPSGLRSGVELEGGEHPRLVDRKSGRHLELTAVEAKILGLYSADTNAVQLVDRARAQGVAVEPMGVGVLLDRLARAGFLARVPPPRPAVGRRPLRLQDAVPMFRADLHVAPSPTSPGLVEVADPVRKRSFTLYDFEASVARMLDGRRTADELIEAAGHIGIPVTLHSLDGFVRQMAAYGFLAPAGRAVDRTASRPERRRWTPDVRELYQSALRLFRTGKGQEALEYLSALLQVDPQNAEALELKQRIEGEPSIDIDFEILHEPEATEDTVGTPSDPSFDGVELSQEELSVVRSKRSWAWLGGLAALALLFPVSTSVQLPCQLTLVLVAKVAAPRDGAVVLRPLPAGAVVKAGDPLATYDTRDLAAALAAARQRLERSQAEIAKLQRKAHAGSTAKLAAKRAAKKRALDQARAREAAFEKAGKKKRRQLAKAKRAARAAETAFKAIDRKYQAATGEAALASLQAASARDQAQVDDLGKQIAAATVTAPAAGLFVAAPPAPHVAKGQELGRLVRPGVLGLSATLPKSATSPALAEATLRLPAGHEGKLQGLGLAEGGQLEASVVDATPLEAATGTLKIPTGRLPLLFRLLK
ncbi:MAG TPA: hypothetical protein VMB50_03450 [Myxococcales bacterium]|nr:hypothetical protein [Myxococcales bacterium]